MIDEASDRDAGVMDGAGGLVRLAIAWQAVRSLVWHNAEVAAGVTFSGRSPVEVPRCLVEWASDSPSTMNNRPAATSLTLQLDAFR